MKKTALILLTLLASSWRVTGQWSTDPANPLPVCDLSCPQSAVNQFGDGNGGSYVFWLDTRVDCSSNTESDIYGQHYDADGVALWEEDGRLIINDAAKIWGYDVTAGPNGQIMLIWYTVDSGNAGKVKAQRIDANGSAVWSDNLLILQSDGCSGYYILGTNNVQLLALDDVYIARINVTYCGGANGNRISKFDEDGNLLSQMSGSMEGDQYYNGRAGIDKTYDGTNDIYLFYTNGNGSGAHASAMRVGAAGDTVFAPLDVLSGTNGLSYQFWALSDEAGLAICYISYGGASSGQDIFLRKLNSDGSWAWGGATTTVCGAEGSQDSFDITQDENYYYICWADGRPGVVGNYALYAQKIDKLTGQVIWTTDGVEVQDVNAYLPKPGIILTGDGNMIIMNEAGASNYFNASLVLADGTLGWAQPVIVSNVLPFYEDYELINSNGNIIVAWARASSSGGSDDIYISRIVNMNVVNVSEEVSACDSYTSNGETFTSSGIYIQEIGDTVLTLDLTIHYSMTTSMDASACFEYLYDGTTYTNSGVYTFPGTTTAGCDSTFTLTLTIGDVNTNVILNGTTLTAEATNSEYNWINCSDNSPMGETGQSFTPMENGSYAVNVITGECAATSECVTVIVNDIKEKSYLRDLQVYPNPGEDLIVVTSPEIHAGSIIKIFDSQGAECASFNSVNADLIHMDSTKLPSGIYTIVLQGEQENFSTRWIKN